MVESECSELGIPFHLLQGEPNAVLPPFLEEHSVGGLVTDFSPLKICRQWVQDIKDKLPKNVPFCQVSESIWIADILIILFLFRLFGTYGYEGINFLSVNPVIQ